MIKNENITKLIINICRHEYNYFLKKTNVIGVGLGHKYIKGINTFEKCIMVYVTKKISINELSDNDKIPIFYKSIKTDVIDTKGLFTDMSLTKKIRPVTGGYSIGNNQAINGGTMGCLVADSNNTRYILSCNHALAKNTYPIGTPILQPSKKDKGTDPMDIVANLSSFIPINYITPTTEPINYVDCAIAELITPLIASPLITFIGLPNGIDLPKLSDSVKKVGKVTELTSGTILSTNTTIYNTTPPNKRSLFLDQIVTTFMAKPGDSGSVLLNNNNAILGLLMAGTSQLTIYNTINNVLLSLRIRVVVK